MGHRQSPIVGQNKLKLGFFSPNCSSGMSVTKVPERWQNTWENNIRLARLADDAGIEFLLPIARWIGYGGETDFHGSVLETVTWASGLLAHTKRINVFATVHTAFIHPIVAAKQLATADMLGSGRLGLNVVAGWNIAKWTWLLNRPTDLLSLVSAALSNVVRPTESDCLNSRYDKAAATVQA